MIPYEIGFGILILAISSTINSAFRERRWLSFLGLCLAAFGITGLASAETAYSQFFMFCPQIVILLGIAVLYCGPAQRLFLSVFCILLLVGFVFLEAGLQNYLDRASMQLGLFAAFVLIPTFIFNVDKNSLNRVDLLISIQQLWLRISMLAWCRENVVNLQHYDIFGSYVEVITLSVGILFLGRLLFNRFTWMLTLKSLLSTVILLGALTMDASQMKLLLALSLVVALIEALPHQADSFVLRRMNLGGFGGVGFWGLCLFALSTPMDGWFRLTWIVIISIFSIGAFVFPLPDLKHEGVVVSSRQVQALMFFGLFLQAAFFGILVFWPQIKELGV